MKSMKLKLAVALTALLATAVTQASERDYPERTSTPGTGWACAMNFNGTLRGFQVIIGKSELKGKGTIRCVSTARQTVEYPVLINIESKPVAASISLGKISTYGEALQIMLTSGQPEDLFGKYYTAQANAAFIAGAGAFVATKVDSQKIQFSVSLQFNHGFGLNLGLRKMTILPDHSRMN
jgi:hypothetical protein